MGVSLGCLRSPSRLSASLNQHLNLYALAASAAGVSLLTLPQPSEAKVVYTKSHQIIGASGIYPLDLNHDGILDFVIQEIGAPGAGSGGNTLWAKEAFGNGIEGSKHGLFGFAAALRKGAPISSGQAFVSSSRSYGEIMINVGCSTLGCQTSGQWINVTGLYLGLKVQINGQTHYGWARLNVQHQAHTITATLTGYAYETVPNKGILAGAIHETGGASSSPYSVESTSAGPASSLGQLALGARGLSLWRQP